MKKIVSKPLSIKTTVVRAGNPQGTVDYIPTVLPLYQSVTFRYKNINKYREVIKADAQGFDYTRSSNPTKLALEDAITLLEGGSFGWATSSGMSAILLSLLTIGLKSGDYFLVSHQIYGGSRKMIVEFAIQLGVKVKFVDITNIRGLERTIARNHRFKALFCESISNPMGILADITEISRICKKLKVKLIVDNTLATPILMKTISLGADLAIHSTTKSIGGHGDILGGIVVSTRQFSHTLRELGVTLGVGLGVSDCWLLHRGLKTLYLRFQRQCENAMAVADWLSSSSEVNKVSYLGLNSHPQHILATKLFGANPLYGTLLTFELKNHKPEAVTDFLESLDLILPTGSVGDIYTQAFDPMTLTYNEIPAGEVTKMGVGKQTIRLSLGIEDYHDIIADLDLALKKSRG